jgi:diguanylate cyclase (GGDEF)-like protein
VLEPIRIPGAVQPHGVLLAVDPSTLTISQVSANADTIVGADPIALLGRNLRELIADSAVAELRDILDPVTATANPGSAEIGGKQFDLIVHETDAALLVELEPILDEASGLITMMRAAFRHLASAKSVAELRNAAAVDIRRITGYDRVMVYHFHRDGHGEVVGEAVADDMEPYLGLHYPASDIPQQARQLYVTKLSRQIVSSAGEAAALLQDTNSPTTTPLDLSVAELRAVSPHHLAFMRNMGQASTFSLSLVRGGVLVGMITCAHRTERRLSFGVREGLEILANQIALQLGAMAEIDRLSWRNHVWEIRSALLTQVHSAESLPESLLGLHLTILDLVPADGACIRLGGELKMLGSTPTRGQLAELPALIPGFATHSPFSSNAIPLDHPGLAAAFPGVAGLLVRPLGRDGDFIAWFRGEVTQTVKWLGDMSPENRLSPLSPRNSFSAWTQDVSGTSEPWNEFEREATELCRDLESILLQRVESRLAEQALRDPLTGLPNRRLLMDRLEQALARHESEVGLALLFADVDRFKSINDDFGHATGDLALIHVADCLRRSVRDGDTVARLGGDEFVVILEGVTPKEAATVADRIRECIAEPPPDDAAWRASVSIGIAFAGNDADPSHLLSEADAAMYRAKVGGRDQVAL